MSTKHLHCCSPLAEPTLNSHFSSADLHYLSTLQSTKPPKTFYDNIIHTVTLSLTQMYYFCIHHRSFVFLCMMIVKTIMKVLSVTFNPFVLYRHVATYIMKNRNITSTSNSVKCNESSSLRLQHSLHSNSQTYSEVRDHLRNWFYFERRACVAYCSWLERWLKNSSDVGQVGH